MRELIELHESAGSLGLQGFIGLPSCHRANRNYQKMIVNGRAVKDKVIIHAIQQAYETLIPKRRHPVVFLFLSLPAQLIDVNVHPTKSEIRFINSQTIHDLVVKGIRNTLSAALHQSSLPSFRTADGTQAVPTTQDNKLNLPAARQSEIFRRLATETDRAFPPIESTPAMPSFTGKPQESNSFNVSRISRTDLSSLPSQNSLTHPIQSGPAVFARMRPIGQFDETYILAQADEELFIVDQHAAHERVFYEKFKAQFQSNAIDIQQLLFPVSIELSHREYAILEEHLDFFRQYGLELEPFGGTTYLLKAVPALLSKADYKKLLYDIIDQLGESTTATIEHKLDEVLILMACHAAIRAHQRLQHSQIIALLQQMDVLELPYTCPHGRPTVIKISLYES